MRSSTPWEMKECKLLPKVTNQTYRYDMYDYEDKFAGEEEAALVDDGFDSDEALFFDNNDLANRIWEDND